MFLDCICEDCNCKKEVVNRIKINNDFTINICDECLIDRLDGLVSSCNNCNTIIKLSDETSACTFHSNKIIISCIDCYNSSKENAYNDYVANETDAMIKNKR